MLAALALAAALTEADCAAMKASARPTIERANGDWVRAMQAHDADAIAAFYADDGLFVQPDDKVVAGRAAVRDLYATAMKSAKPVTGGAIAGDGLACGGPDLLYEWGQAWAATRGADGGELRRGGPYLTVWKRVGGEWRIFRNLPF